MDTSASLACVYIVVNFLSQVVFVFLLVFGMVMYANEVGEGKIKITKDKKLTTTYTFMSFELLYALRAEFVHTKFKRLGDKHPTSCTKCYYILNI